MADAPLLPCPFCGLPAVIENNLGREFWAQCDDSHIEGTMYPTEAEARAAWNRRTPSPPVAAPPATPVAPVAFRTLLNGDQFQFEHGGRTFIRDKSFFRTLPDGDNGRAYPAVMNALVYPVAPQPQPAQPLTGAQIAAITLEEWGPCSLMHPATIRKWSELLTRAVERAHGITAPSTHTPPEVAP